ncbi:hypothetical protein B296_00001640 [Ensete ventricosum]|uniref:SBP-type domain-containing protein n=1 Tax=Ensete ventricosum TaxID=4639 RepID=A0A427B517_ENSVE|nr:hypothetical protein B296_00001640 [Ensete ventricosum]
MNNKSSSAEAFLPSTMPFSGLEGSSQKQHHIWDWETSSHNPNTTIPGTTYDLRDHAFFPCLPLPDCPPPLLPMSTFHFYSPPPMPDYPVVLIKTEDGTGGCGRIGLNLGHRTYFSSGDALAIDRQFSRSTLSNHQPRCQAEGCKADLSGAKHYHRRHRVCEFHSKATVGIIGGLQQRFCQQCSSSVMHGPRSCSRRRRTQPRGVSEMGVVGFVVFASPGRRLWHGKLAAVPSTLKVSESRLAYECGSQVSPQIESGVCVRLQGMGCLDDQGEHDRSAVRSG